MDASAPTSFTINGVVVDLDRETLHDGAGNPIALRPQAFSVLRYLLQHPDRLVSKEEIMQVVWPATAVTDDSLVQCVRDVRRALGDEAHAVLKTVSRRGYRLNLPDGSNGRMASRRLLATAAALCLIITAVGVLGWRLHPPSLPGGIPVVAVLPFEVVAEEEAASRRLADGLTRDIITDLARFPEFEVIAHNSTEKYAGRAVSASDLNRALGVSFVVEGSIQRHLDRVRITTQLTDATDGRKVWSNRWDRPDREVFAIQTEIAEQVANRLGGGAGVVQETGRIAARRKAPSSLSAYELYLLGTERLEKVDRANLEAALELLTEAVRLDPGLARGWVELFHTHELLANLGVEPERNRALAAAAAERALALDPSDAEAHVVYGGSLGMRGNFAKAEAEFETALRMAPNAAEILIFYIGWASSFGKPERGAELVERAIRLDPNYPTWANRPFAAAYFMAGRYRESVAMFERLGIEKHNRWSWAAHAGALAASDRRSEATSLVEKALAAHPDLSIEVMTNEPGWTDAERQRFIDTMRLAGFPACADPEVLARFDRPRRLPECASH
jgi:TolB-like protein/DNA-binding winged helix-turn-helix (wHTH) protein